MAGTGPQVRSKCLAANGHGIVGELQITAALYNNPQLLGAESAVSGASTGDFCNTIIEQMSLQLHGLSPIFRKSSKEA
jgi:hypothetical protein